MFLEIVMLVLVAVAFFIWGFTSALNKVSQLTARSLQQKDEMLNLAQDYLRGKVTADPIKIMGLVMMYIAKPSHLYNRNDLTDFKKELKQLKREGVNVKQRKTTKTPRPNRRTDKANLSA